MSEQSTSNVSSGDFVRNFSHFREEAARHPVFVTTYGRRSHVLMSMPMYEQLGRDDPHAVSGHEQLLSGSNLVFMLADWVDDGLIVCDSDARVVFANRVAQGLTGRPVAELIDHPIQAALPAIRGSLIEGNLLRTQQSRTANSAEVPSPFGENRWLRFQSFPVGDFTVLKLRDITEEMQALRLANVKEALLDAMSVHGAIGYARISVRATIDRVDGPFRDVIGLPEEKLKGVALADLVDLPMRAQFRETVERVIRTNQATQLHTSFLSNSGKVVPMLIAIVPLVGNYGFEGAIVLMTWDRAGA